MKRNIFDLILNDLQQKMVFITGPRQVGKTYLAQQIMDAFSNPQYLNYDVYEDRVIIHGHTWNIDADLVIFDEIHKMKNWKAFLKGAYDAKPKSQSLLITGSARMETFRQSGESLAGRYFHHRLLPISVKEAESHLPPAKSIIRLNTVGGFPEPFLDGTEETAARWQNQYYTDLIREDILEFSRIHELKTMRMLLDMLRNRIGSPVSFKALSEDLQIAPNTVKKYMEILESLYIIFLVYPFSKNIARSILKEPKVYLFDSGYVRGDDGIHFENTCAVSLLKHIYHMQDAHGKQVYLHYLRTKDKREIDFAIIENESPTQLIEVKWADANISKPLLYFKKKWEGISAVQLVCLLRQERTVKDVSIVKAEKWLSRLSV